MTNLPEKEDIRKAVIDDRILHGLSQSKHATKIGVSDATLSKIENGDWESITERLWQKVWNAVSPSDLKLIQTNNLHTIEEACTKSRKMNLMTAIIGDTGLGKTTALQRLSKRKNTYYVSYEKTLKPKQFFSMLLKEMSIPFEGNIHEMVNKIAEELNSQSNPLIIIDEAGKITHTMVLYLHVIRDKTCKNCGIILAGMPYFKTNMDKMANKQKEGYAEFRRRINSWITLKKPTHSEIKALCEVNGIKDNQFIQEMYNHRDFGSLYNDILFNNHFANVE